MTGRGGDTGDGAGDRRIGMQRPDRRMPRGRIGDRPRRSAYDVVIIGGASSGSAIAWSLSMNPDFDGTVLVVERDASLARSATMASNNGLRQQFGTEVNVRLSQYTAEFISDFRGTLGGDPRVPELPVREFGYLYLADDEAGAQQLRRNLALQQRCGAATQALGPADIASRFPELCVEDITVGTLNLVREGTFDAPVMVQWLRDKAIEQGVEYVEAEVVSMTRRGPRIEAVELASGERLTVGLVVNAAGTRAADVARLAGVDLPIEPRRRYTYIFRPQRPLAWELPLTIDPSGPHMRAYSEHDYLVGGPPIGADVAVEPDDFETPEPVWEEKLWPMVRGRIPSFEPAEVVTSWVGHYEYNTFDQNAFVGSHAELPGMILCNGFSGHGSQQAPGCGRGVAELITYGEFRTLDLSPLSHARVPEGRPLVEGAVI